MLERSFPTADYSEEQPFSHAILTAHVVARGFSLGSLVGAFVSAPRFYFQPSYRAKRLTLPNAVLTAATRGSLVGSGIMALATVGRMWGKEKIEWQDRAWRLLVNKGQNRADDMWTAGGLLGGALGVLGGAARRNYVGAVALGSAAALIGAMGTEKKKVDLGGM